MVLMYRVCAWCNKDMGIVEVEEEVKSNEEILETHGICEECVEKYFKENDAKDSLSPIALMRVTQIEDPSELLNEFEKNNIIVEEKLDGWKTQVIKSNGVIKIYSRKGDDKTENFPELIEAVGFLPDNTIVEGELVYWENGKQDEGKVTSLAGSTPEHALEKAKEFNGEIKLHLYDVIFLNGEDISQKPFVERRQILESIVEQSDRVQITKQYGFDNWQEAMEEAVKSGGEGIVLKITNQPYEYKTLGENEPKPKGIMYKYKGGIGKSETDDYVVYKYDISDKGKLRAYFGQYYDGKLFHISEISNFSEENEEIIKDKLNSGQVVIEIGFQERLPGGLRHQKFVRFREDKDPKDATMDDFHVQNISNFEIVKQAYKKAYSVSDFMDSIMNRKKSLTKSLQKDYSGLRNVPGVDVKKAYDIFAALESSNSFITGDSGTSFGKTQVQIGSFLNAIANDPSAQDVTGIPPQDLREFSAEWKRCREKLSSYNWKETISVNEVAVAEFKRKHPDLIKERKEGTIIRVFPDGKPGVIRIINGRARGEVLNLQALNNLGLDTSSSDIMNKVKTIMQQFVTWAVVQNALARVMAYQKLPEIHNKIMNVFSSKNVNNNEKLLRITDMVSKTNLMDKIETVVNAVKQYGYDTTAPGAYNIYQLIGIANASGAGRVVEFLKTKKPFGAGNLTYLYRANRKIQEVTGISTSMPANQGLGGFTSMASYEFEILKNANYSEDGVLYFPAQYADSIKSGKRKVTIRANDVPVEVGEQVLCKTLSDADICNVRIISKNKMSLTRIEKAFGKRMARTIEQQFGPNGQYVVIRFEPYEVSMADDSEDEEKWKEVLINKDGVKLTRQKIKNHYMKPGIRKMIMSRIKDKPVLLYLGIGKNESILKRNHKGKPIVITNDDLSRKNKPDNYYYWVDRRLLSIHEVFGKTTKIGFIDLDLHGDFSFENARKYAKEVSVKIKEIYGVSPIIYQSGGSGIHIEFDLKKETNINTLRSDLKKLLGEINNNWEGVTTGLVEGTGMRSDVSTLHNKGSLRVPGSLGETYGKEKKEIEEANIEDDFGTKNIQEPGSEGVPPMAQGKVPCDSLGSYYANYQYDFVKRAFRRGVKKEYLWMWDYLNHRLYFDITVEDGKEKQITHEILAHKNNIIPKTIETNPRGFVTFYDDGRIEVETYEISFDEIRSDARSAVISYFNLRNKYFDVSVLMMPKGTTKPKKEEIELGASEINKLNKIWRLAKIIDIDNHIIKNANVEEEIDKWLNDELIDPDKGALDPEQIGEFPPEEVEETPESFRDVSTEEPEKKKRTIEETPSDVPWYEEKVIKQPISKKDKEISQVKRDLAKLKYNLSKQNISEEEFLLKQEQLNDKLRELGVVTEQPIKKELIEKPTESKIEIPVVIEEKKEEPIKQEDFGEIFILNPVEICEEEGDWAIPCQEVFELRHLYFPTKNPMEIEDIEKEEKTSETEIAQIQKNDLIEIKENFESKEDNGMEWSISIGSSPMDESQLISFVDDTEDKIAEKIPLFGKKLSPPMDISGKAILTTWPSLDIDPNMINFSDEEWNKFSYHNLTNQKELRKVFSSASDYMEYFKKNPDLAQKWVLPILIHHIGKKWFDINKGKRYIGGRPFGMFDESDAEIIQAQELKFEDIPKGQKYISEINKVVTKCANAYFSSVSIGPIDKYIYAGLDHEMMKIIAKDNFYKEKRVVVCAICKGESVGNSVDPIMELEEEKVKKKRKPIPEKMKREEIGKKILWTCSNCQRKAEEIELSEIPQLDVKIKNISKNIMSLQKSEETEEVLKKIEENNIVLEDLLDQKKELNRKMRVYKSQKEIPRIHTWCPSESCPGQLVPLTAIDWESDFWKSPKALLILKELENKYGVVPPEGFKHPVSQNDDDKKILDVELYGFKPWQQPPLWLDDVPFVCPHDNVKFILKESRGKGVDQKAGFLWSPFQRVVWEKEGEKKQIKKEDEDNEGKEIEISSDDFSDELENYRKLSDLAKDILLRKYWAKRENFVANVAGMSFETVMRQKTYPAQVRSMALYDSLRNFSTNDNIAYVGWLAGQKIQKGLIEKGKIISEQKTIKKSKNLKELYREEIHIPILQTWVNKMLSVSENWLDGFNTYKLNQWLAGEREGIKSVWKNTYGTFFVAKIDNNISDASEMGGKIYGFISNLKDKSVVDPKQQKRSKDLRLLKVLGVYKVQEEDISSLTEGQKNGEEDIQDERIVNKLMKEKINFSNNINSYSFNNVKMKEDSLLVPGDYVLVHALVISGNYNHPAFEAIREIRKDNDKNNFFEELGKLAVGQDDPKVWQKLNAQVTEIKEKMSKESSEKQLDVIKEKIQEFRNALREAKTSTASLSIRAGKDPLSIYKSKRDFEETPEPEGEVGKGNKHRFVIQKHDASKLHFDLRLENDDGVLQSWAIPKHKMPEGKEKLLAVETEPHPISYLKFKGEISSGYGAGEVDIFASGTYKPIEVKKDKIVFEIGSGKAAGKYVLYRTSGKKWLLMVSKSNNKDK